MSFNQAAVLALFNDVVSDIQTLGVFETVNQHEPKSAPQNGFVASVWMDAIDPVGRASGLAATSGVVTLMCRCYSSMLLQPVDNIDPGLMSAVATVLNVFSTGYSLSGSVRDVDLLGMYGKSLSAQAGYVSIDNKMFRVMTITIPVIINDMFTQAP
jgi:hypothetical protein